MGCRSRPEVNLQDGQIGGFIAPHDLGGAHRTVVQAHLDDGGFPVRENHRGYSSGCVLPCPERRRCRRRQCSTVRCHDAGRSEGRTFFAVSATPVTVDELLILNPPTHERELEEEEPAEAVKDPTPAPTPPPTRAASTGRSENNSAAVTLALLRGGEATVAVARYP